MKKGNSPRDPSGRCTQSGCYCGCYLCKGAGPRPGPVSHCESHISGCHVSCQR